VPIESCGRSSPLRVSLQATAPDILLIFLRYGANPLATSDGGTSPIVALLDKLTDYDESASYPYQLVSCYKILVLAIPFIELPYKVSESL
jgi:ankyrin repeat and SOCS box protein 17